MATADDFIEAVGSSFGEFTFSVTDGELSADGTGEQMIGRILRDLSGSGGVHISPNGAFS